MVWQLTVQRIAGRARRALGSGSLLSIGSSAAMGGAGLVSGLLVARAVGVSERGLYAGITTIPFLVMQISMVSFDDALVRSIGSKAISAAAAARTVRRWGWIWGLGIAAILWPIHAFLILPPGHLVYAAVVALFAPAFILTRLLQGVVLGQGRSIAWNAQRMIGGLVYSAIVACLFLLGEISIPTLLAAWAISYVASLGLSWLHTGPATVGSSPELDGSNIRSIVGYGAQLSVARICGQLSQGLDQAFLSVAVASHEMGLYVVAATVAYSPSVLVYGYSAFVYSSCSRSHGDRFSRYHVTVILRGFLLASALYVPLFIAVPWVLTTGFGPDFLAAVRIARLLCLGAFAYSGTLVVVSVLNAMGHARHTAVAQASSVVVLAVCLILLVPSHGPLGAACASVLANMVNAVIVAGFIFGSWRSGRSSPPHGHAEQARTESKRKVPEDALLRQIERVEPLVAQLTGPTWPPSARQSVR